ncbi:DUF1631 family protein [Noviherbaspirillum cavernae]|uniref:DUF1631 family protein n=1 Tax=Noviherbaspirillum cavernae TaxID=2320862 RepID=A0A418X396_9BURK|nr:DUF1631 family protein [Noviherbaspirillum cavernae]RJG06940.1 DUF1631 family protein [Noviherbaspirillum cavernae]
MADQLANHPCDKAVPPSFRMPVLRTLVSIASQQLAAQQDAFVSRLLDALSTLADHAARSSDTEIAANAFRHLSRNRATFHRLLPACLADALQQELRATEQPEKSPMERDAIDLSLVTFEAMEQKVLIDHLSHALDAANTEALDALNIRIASLLGKVEVGIAHNPFRPHVFLQAVADAWGKFDLSGTSQRVVLNQMRPEVFLQLDPILRALNDALIANGIVPNLADAYRLNKLASHARHAGEMPRRNLPIYDKLNRWLSPSELGTAAGPHGRQAVTHPGLRDYLRGMQGAQTDASVLRQIGQQAPRGMLSQADENAIELLARMFDRVLDEPHIPADIKRLLVRLQVPMLKAALADDEFFFRADHPARRLVDTVVKSGVGMEQGPVHDDPLYRMIEGLVDRVQQEYDAQLAMFDNAATDLESFLAQEAQVADAALSHAVAQALQQERIARARELAAHHVSLRIESGEVPGFVEAFLQSQWTRVLGLAHTVEDTRPDALPGALKAMDELIWSVKPKNGGDERKELLGRLPSLLSTLNAWLNVVKWDGAERVAFFSSLAERHASIARTAGELSPRAQLEITMNAVQRASERRLNLRATEQADQPADVSMHLVDGLEPDAWVEFVRNSGAKARYRLAWISPRRTRFIFAGRRGQEPFTLTFEELAQSFREDGATAISIDAALDRAMNAVLEEMDA